MIGLGVLTLPKLVRGIPLLGFVEISDVLRKEPRSIIDPRAEDEGDVGKEEGNCGDDDGAEGEIEGEAEGEGVDGEEGRAGELLNFVARSDLEEGKLRDLEGKVGKLPSSLGPFLLLSLKGVE